MNKIADQRMIAFLADLGSQTPTPGGGAVAALAGAMAAALVEKVINLTKEEEIKKLLTKTRQLKQKLLDLADEDCAAFEAVMAAYKSKSKVKEALQKAIDVPRKTAFLASEVEKLAKIMVEKGNSRAVSDALSAVYLAQASQKAAQENIKINNESLMNLGTEV